ncbi:uncharacterized protein LOC142591406 [Dermacentor variabilis]|uniref:uncharacterized protein LOC142591406 n=1 Tax=Dermacentor variabilis TaxID=34621 RepID=UPI003F5B156F
MHDQCVTKTQCGLPGKADDDAGKGREPKPEEYEIPEQLQGSPEDARRVLKFIQSTETFCLLMVNKDQLPYTFKDYSPCLKSRYIKNTPSGAERTLESYEEVKFPATHFSMPVKHSQADFELLVEHGWMKITINLGEYGPLVSSERDVIGIYRTFEILVFIYLQG